MVLHQAFSTVMAPNIAPSAAVAAWPAARARTSAARAASQRAASISAWPALRHPHLSPGCRPSCCHSACGRLRQRRACVGRELQRRGAAHQRVGGVDRHVGHALQAGCGRRPGDGGAARRCPAARQSRPRRPAPRRAPLRRFPASKPARPSRLPSTRSTFQAGRASPSGLTTPWKLCSAAFGIDEGAGGFGERRDRQQHVGDVEPPRP